MSGIACLDLHGGRVWGGLGSSLMYLDVRSGRGGLPWLYGLPYGSDWLVNIRR